MSLSCIGYGIYIWLRDNKPLTAVNLWLAMEPFHDTGVLHGFGSHGQKRGAPFDYVGGPAMNMQGWLLIALFVLAVVLTIRPFGGYMAFVFSGRRASLWGVKHIENAFFHLAGPGAAEEQTWQTYTSSLLLLNFAGILMLFGIILLQGWLPFNPQHMGMVEPGLALNTAVSFVTNTSWQAYAGETTLSYFSQMAGITVESFVSAATGMAVAVAMIRGFTRKNTGTIGNAWSDVTRATLFILLPIAVIGALFLAWQGVPQTLDGAADAVTLEGAAQTIARGPVASQEVIKLLSGDGGGFFNANSAHPFENPTLLSNFFEMLLIFLIGAALTNTFGRMAGNERQGWSLFGAMTLMFAAGLIADYGAESASNPHFASLGIDQLASSVQAGGNMEGKEVRFGIANSALFANVATTSSDGAVNAMFDSFSPLGGGVLLANMMADEVIVGAPGSGLFGMLLYALVGVFIAGLMVGRTPEYLGKKIQSAEVKLVVLALLAVPAATLLLASAAAIFPAARDSLSNSGPHGFSELLYAYTSAAATNGSAFAGLNANTPFFNVTLALAMLCGRYLVIVPVLAIAGSLAAKGKVPASAGTFPTDNALFVFLIVATVILVGALTFFPSLALGPLAEQFSNALN